MARDTAGSSDCFKSRVPPACGQALRPVLANIARQCRCECGMLTEIQLTTPELERVEGDSRLECLFLAFKRLANLKVVSTEGMTSQDFSAVRTIE